MKRTAALYRVSTKKQVDIEKDDIPMQRIACREFALRQGWTLVKELEEKGVSGFKVSAEKRDAIQELKEAALHKEFDILLVFMFDRLGRIENETPFVLEWFTSHGIEVWSVQEGQQKFEHHVDKLMNYIRFWQASGESEKTSIRVKTRLQQMTSEGIYTGGVVPYGYELVPNGRKNKKGHEMRDLEVLPEEAEIVKIIFRKTVSEGYGSHMLSTYLNEKGYRTHSNAEFQSNYILRILKNEIYRGYMVHGEVRSERVEALQLVSDAEWLKAQDILKQRARKNEDKRSIAMTNKGSALLSGNVYCAHCGCRLATSRYKENELKTDGTYRNTEYGRYVCYHRSRGLNDCDGASTYRSEKIDEAVIKVMKQIFDNISGCPREEKIKSAYQKMVSGNHKLQQKLITELKKDNEQLEKLQLEIGKCLLGDSVYNPEDLSNAIKTLRIRIDESENKLNELKNEESEKRAVSDSIIPTYQRFKTWADEFEASSFETKKMIANELFSRIEIGKGYSIHIEMNLTYKQFCEDWYNPAILTATA